MRSEDSHIAPMPLASKESLLRKQSEMRDEMRERRRIEMREQARERMRQKKLRAAETKAQQPDPHPAEPGSLEPDSVEGLVRRMTAIRERIWRLQAVFATSLSQECALEANLYLRLFQELGAKLRQKNPDALEDLVRGHESLLQSPYVPVKPTIPLHLQQWHEPHYEINNRHEVEKPKPPRYLGDGLQQFL